MTLPVPEPAPATPAPPVLTTTGRIRDRAKTLPEARMLSRGYDTAAVDAFVEDVCRVVDELTERVQSLQTHLDQAWAELDARRSGLLPDRTMSGPAGDLLMNLQRAAMQQGDEMVRSAAEQGRLIVTAAQREADELLERARAQADMIESRAGAKAAAMEQLAASMLDYVARTSEAVNTAYGMFHGEWKRIAGQTGPAGPDVTGG